MVMLTKLVNMNFPHLLDIRQFAISRIFVKTLELEIPALFFNFLSILQFPTLYEKISKIMEF